MDNSAPRIPKPGPFKPKAAADIPTPKPPVVKKPFIPKPHLTARPFQDSEELKALQKSITTPIKTTQPGRRNSRKSSK